MNKKKMIVAVFLALVVMLVPAAYAAGNVYVTSSGRQFEVRFEAKPVNCGGSIAPAHINVVLGGVNFHIGVTSKGLCIGNKNYGFNVAKMLKELFSNQDSKKLLSNSRVEDMFTKLLRASTSPIIPIVIHPCILELVFGGTLPAKCGGSSASLDYCIQNPKKCGVKSF